MSVSSTTLESAPVAARTRAAGVIAFAVIALAVILERLPTIGFAYLNVDESAYLMIGAALHHGAIPYVDIIDRKPVGLYLIYGLANAVFSDAIVGARIFGGFCTLISAWLVAYIGRRFLKLSWPACTLAAVYFSLYAILYGGDAAQYNVFNMPFVAAAAVLVLTALEAIAAGVPPSALGIGVAGLLLGFSMQVKYTAAFEAMAFGLSLIVAGWRRRIVLGPAGRATLIRGLALMVAGGLLPTLIAAAAYWRIGHFAEFWFYNFTVNVVRTATDYPVGLLWFRIGEALLIVHPLIIFSVLYARRGASRSIVAIDTPGEWVDLLLAAWLTAALFGALVQRQPYLHYFYAIVPPLTLFTAAALGGSGRFSRKSLIAIGFYVAAPVIGYFGGWRFEIADHGSARLPRVIARTLRSENVKSLYVFNYFGILYHLSGLDSPTRFTLPTHLLRDLEAASFQFDAPAEVARILESHPQVIAVTRPFAANIAANRIELLEAALRRNYCTWHVYAAGRDQVYLYRYEGKAGDPSRPCGERASSE